MTISGLVVMPLYLRVLSEEEFGLFSFLTMANGLLMMLELGFSKAVSHEFASVDKNSSISDLAITLRTTEWFFVPIGILLASVLFFSAEFIAYSWLGATSSDALLAIRLIAAIVFFQWVILFYQAALLGLENHTFINFAQIIYLLFVASSGLILLYLKECGVVELLVCYLTGSILLSTTFGWLSWKKIGKARTASFCKAKARKLLGFALKVAGVALPGIILMQIDKVAASNILGIEKFGWYMLVASIASSIGILATPVYQVAFPRFTALVSKGNVKQLKTLFRIFSQISALMLFPVAVTLAIFSEPILRIYTGNQDLAQMMWPVLSILIVAKAFHASNLIAYAVQLAQKKLRLAFQLNIFSLLLMGVSLPIFTVLYGVIGLAWSWLFVTLGYVTIGMWLFHKQFFNGGYWKWLFIDNLSVITLSVLISFLTLKWFEPNSNLIGLSIIAMSGLTSLLISFLANPNLRIQAISIFKVMRSSR